MQETNTGQFCGFESHSQHSFRHPVRIENDIMTSYEGKAGHPSQNYPPPGQPGYPQGQPGYPQGQPGYPQGQPQYGYPSNAVVVQQPQHFVVQGGARPSDYLILSIISIFFCWPMAICAIVFSCNSKSSSDAGDYATAESQGRTARNIGIAAIVIGLIIIIIAIAVPLALAAAATASISRFCTGSNCYYG